MAIIILQKNLEYLGTDIFSQQWVDENSMMVYGNSFRILSVIRFSFTITTSSDKDNIKRSCCSDLATSIFNSATSEIAIIFRKNKHLIY